MSTLTTARKSEDVLRYLQGRRSCPLNLMDADAEIPTQDIEQILRLASRVPDHGRLYPWYFVVLQGKNRRKMGEILRTAYRHEDPDASEEKLDIEAARFLRAPLVIIVVSRMRQGAKPLWEQILSSGAACFNLSLAANALGYGTNWLSEWYSYNPVFKEALGLDARDHIAGAIHIGPLKDEQPEERPRPDLDELVTWWEPGAALKKGELYNKDTMGLPHAGFILPGDGAA